MVLARWLLALLLSVAIPLQGFAAATCLCKVQPHGVPGAGATGAGDPQHAGSASMPQPGMALAAAEDLNKDRAGPAPFKEHCSTCSVSCCKVTVSTSDLVLFEGTQSPDSQVADLGSRFASWAEPLPDKPPRS